MNKKLIIGLVLGGALIAGALYLYNQNKKALKKNLTSESDAIQVAKLVGERRTPYNSEQTKKFVELYTTNIDAETNEKIKTALSKSESYWNEEDKQASSNLTEYVLKFVPKK